MLVVDEAHLLTLELLEEIRLLTNADTHHEKLLQVILSGQPELLPLLRRPELSALKQRIASRSELRALTLPETGVYISERLHAAHVVRGFFERVDEVAGEQVVVDAVIDEDVRERSRGECDVRASREQPEHVTDCLVDRGRVSLGVRVDGRVVGLVV